MVSQVGSERGDSVIINEIIQCQILTHAKFKIENIR